MVEVAFRAIVDWRVGAWVVGFSLGDNLNVIVMTEFVVQVRQFLLHNVVEYAFVLVQDTDDV